jgi:RHS repeat-associated protein
LYRIVKPDDSYIEIKYEVIVNGEKWANKSIDEQGIVQEVRYNPIAKTVTEIDGDGIETTFVYDDSHNITEEHYADGTNRSSHYDEHGNIDLQIYRNDITTYSYEYNGERIKNKTVKYSDQSTEFFEYNRFSQVTHYKDRDGIEYFYDYDDIGNLISVKKGSATVFTGRYRGDLLEQSTDGLNVVTEYKYDGYGNIEIIKTGRAVETFTYDSRNRLKSYTDGEENKTSYSYTKKSRIETYANGLERIYHYNNRKDLVKIEEKDTVRKETRITYLAYDKKHNLLEVTNPSVVDKNGNPVVLEKYTYRGNNELESITYSDGQDYWKTIYLYDEAGRISKKLSTKNGQDSFYQEDYAYPPEFDSSNWKMVTTGESRGTVYKYDEWGRVKSVTNALGETSERELSPAGLVKKENSSHGGIYIYGYTNGNLSSLQEENKEKQVRTEYYNDGTVKSVTDRLGNKTEYFYNQNGLLEKTLSKENAVWYTYDNAGRVIGQYITEPDALNYNSKQDSYITYSYKDKGRTVTASYGGLYTKTMKLNAFGEVIEVTDGEGNTVKYEYDALGRQTAVYDGYDKAERYEYNALGLVAKITYRDGSKEYYEYDCLGNITEITDSEGTKAVYGYDSAGRLTSSKERGSALTEYTYDVLDRVIQVKLAGSIVEQNEYTSFGRKTTVTDGNENKYQYNYDEYGRLVNETNRLEDSQYYFYDDEGSLEKKKDFEAKTTTYEYDPATRTRTVYYSNGSAEVYEYSAGGNLLHVTGETGTISYTYNKAGLPVSQVDHGAGETTYYSYNKAGLKSKVQSDSRTIAYTYGKNGEVTKVEDYMSKMSVTLTYDVMGRETKRRYKNGVSENTAYDSIGRVILKSETDAYGKISFAESYVYDSEGRRWLSVTKDGGVTLYKYNLKGELHTVYYPYSESLELEAKKEALEAGLYPKYPGYEWYDYTLEETELINQAWSRIYKNTPLRQQKGQRVWSEQYTYDNNSNRLTKTTQYGTINYTYDDENRLRYSGREKLVNLESEIGGRITFRENDEIYHAATADSVSYSTDSLKGTRYTYDKNGNMLSSENLYSVKFFDYNANSRMKLSTVTDLTEHTYTATTYAYDGLGRRTLTQTEGHTATRTLYDGTGFEILRQGTADSNGSFVNYSEAQNRYSPYYPKTGSGMYKNRYGYADYFYYLFFGGIWGFGNGGHGSKNGQEEAPEYLNIENMYPLYANGSVSGTFKEDLVYSPHKHYWNSWNNLWGADTSRYDDYATYKETLYFGTDVLGSVRTTSSYSVFDFGSINYDVFGSPYRRAGSFLNSESLDFGYLGKPYNATTELYDYGFRDYSPRNARFSTVDPIRDGRNWYTYVLNDPVNYVDLWGLERADKKIIGKLFSNISSGFSQLFNGDSGQDYKQLADQALKNGDYLQYALLTADGLTEAALDVILNPVTKITSVIDNFCLDKLGLGLPEMAMTLQSSGLTAPAGEALYHFSNWARATSAGTGSAFVSAATNIGVETVAQAAGLVGINANSINNLTPNQGYSSFRKLKKNIGSAGEGKDWHHIVEQSQIKKSGFSPSQIHNTSNIIAVDHQTHMKITGYYTRIYGDTGLSLRDWLAGQSYETQYQVGLDVLRMYNVIE